MAYIRNYDMAVEFLAAGRMKDKYRPISKNVYLARVDADTIALVLHDTAIVTYYSNKTAILYTGGWWSVTTKAKIGEFSAVRPGSNGKGSWIIVYTDELTAAKVQKCRARGNKDDTVRGCQGTGKLETITRCSGPEGTQNFWYSTPDNNTNLCAGNVVCGGESYRFAVHADGSTDYRDCALRPCVHGETESHTLKRCEHDVAAPGNRKYHAIEACEHGQWSSHNTGTQLVECSTCNGTGFYDYGSKPIPVLWDAGAIRVSDDGSLVEVAVTAPHAPGRQHDWTKVAQPVLHMAYKSSPTHIDGSLAASLAAVLPGLAASVKCPHPVGSCADMSVRQQIVHLNDQHRWTRERIADWLDTLDVDLAFKVA